MIERNGHFRVSDLIRICKLGLRLVSKLTVDTSNFCCLRNKNCNFFTRSYIQSVIKISVNKIYLKKKGQFYFYFFRPPTLTFKS